MEARCKTRGTPRYGCNFYISAWSFHQVGHFWRDEHFPHNPRRTLNDVDSQADPWHYSTDNSRILGLCTGALAAAAVSCSRSALELIPMAIDAVIVAFRTGMRVVDIAQRVEPSDVSDQSWSIIVSGSGSAGDVFKLCEQTVRTSS